MEIQNYWSGLLLLTEKVRDHTEAILFCFMKFGKEPEVYINRLPVPDPECPLLLIHLDSDNYQDHALANIIKVEGIFAHLEKNLNFSEEAARFLCQYLPYCFLSIRARRWKRAIAITHFAQSLDGKIATLQGDSKWIGNEQNLIHAHRMRALCDGILIGSKTMNCDHPSLTVRLVEGKNPVRIVLCSSEGNFSSLRASAEERILVMGLQQDPCIEGAEYLQCSPNQEGKISCQHILSSLYERGIGVVYIEGGAATSSQFMKEKMVDVVQLHLAPVIFGSGVSNFSLPEIEWVQEAIHFTRYAYQPAGSACMFTGELNLDANA